MLKLAFNQLLAQYKSGDLRVLLFALILAISSITAVNFFTYRISAHLNSQGGLLIGGDLAVIADHAIGVINRLLFRACLRGANSGRKKEEYESVSVHFNHCAVLNL